MISVRRNRRFLACALLGALAGAGLGAEPGEAFVCNQAQGRSLILHLDSAVENQAGVRLRYQASPEPQRMVEAVTLTQPDQRQRINPEERVVLSLESPPATGAQPETRMFSLEHEVEGVTSTLTLTVRHDADSLRAELEYGAAALFAGAFELPDPDALVFWGEPPPPMLPINLSDLAAEFGGVVV